MFLSILGFEFNQIAQIMRKLNNFFNKYGIEFKNIDDAMASVYKS